MPPRLNRLERLANLVLALLETPRPLSLREIGATVAGYPPEPGALRQAFERDKRTLRDGGIPIVVERLDNDDQVGYTILPEDYYLPDLGLDDDERQALAFALAAVRLDGMADGDLAEKLGLQTMDLAPVAVLPSLPALGVLHDAISARRLASFDYRDRLRLVESYGLVFREGSWYLLGRDRTSQDDKLRSFRVDRIAGAVQLDEPGGFEVASDFDPSSALSFDVFSPRGADGEGALEVVLDVDVREVRRVLNVVGQHVIRRRGDDGSLELSFVVGDEEAFISFVLGLGDAVEVVAPAELRGRVIDRLESATGKSR